MAGIAIGSCNHASERTFDKSQLAELSQVRFCPVGQCMIAPKVFDFEVGMEKTVSELTLLIVADAVKNRSLMGGIAMQVGDLYRLSHCVAIFIGADAEEALWERTCESVLAASQSETALISDIELLIPERGRREQERAVPLLPFVETYLHSLGDLIGPKLCVHHVTSCFVE